jgi:DNA-nicking Smr family endonuclease
MAAVNKRPGARGVHAPPPEDDASLWAWATRETKPLPGRPVGKPARPVKVAKERALPAPSLRPVVRTNIAAELSAKATAGIDRRTADRFLRGKMEIDATLDLHGMTQSEAHGALDAFLDRAIARGFRCVIIVTGKGGRTGEAGVLRTAVPRWLNQVRHRDQILSFAPAQRKHGGEGAIYILLRRHRTQTPASRS